MYGQQLRGIVRIEKRNEPHTCRFPLFDLRFRLSSESVKVVILS
jgi:hypothetical protein